MEATYHFRCLGSSVVSAHLKKNGNIRSAERDSSREGLAGIVLYLNRDLLGGRKEYIHVLHRSLPLGEGRDLPHQLGYLLPVGNVRKIWTGEEGTHTFHRLVVEVVQTMEGLSWVVVSSTLS